MLDDSCNLLWESFNLKVILSFAEKLIYEKTFANDDVVFTNKFIRSKQRIY
jgi:hypothetical protein